jgi:hypothetical protein
VSPYVSIDLQQKYLYPINHCTYLPVGKYIVGNFSKLIGGGCHVYKKNQYGNAKINAYWSTSQSRKTESIVSMERGVCTCVELQDVSCYRWRKVACQATSSISTTEQEINTDQCLYRQEYVCVCVMASMYIYICVCIYMYIRYFAADLGAEGNPRYSDWYIRRTYTIVCHRQKQGGPG